MSHQHGFADRREAGRLLGEGLARHKLENPVVLAVPVAPADTLHELEPLCDEVVCLVSSEFFSAVGAHYRDFDQTTDGEVVRLLSDAALNPRS